MNKVYYRSLTAGLVAGVVVDRDLNSKRATVKVTAVSKAHVGFPKGALVNAPFAAVDAR